MPSTQGGRRESGRAADCRVGDAPPGGAHLPGDFDPAGHAPSRRCWRGSGDRPRRGCARHAARPGARVARLRHRVPPEQLVPLSGPAASRGGGKRDAGAVPQRSRQLLELVESSPDGFVVTTADGRSSRPIGVPGACAASHRGTGARPAAGPLAGPPGRRRTVLLANLRQRGPVRLFATTCAANTARAPMWRFPPCPW